ncbi:unnamed protein product [Paramecium primaurelia]|uniref:H-type lectin domain-containing protein n=1 Tax=Paramecium primaurelia TaxID=5886 RepID=A0A8S1PSX1_PARPR|nr:unnamed protein product [Paramecium primaurelia]
MIWLTLLWISQGYIIYEESTFRSFNVINKGFICFKNYERTQNVYFNDSFRNIPKIILIPELFDIPTQSVDYSLEILAVTEKYFTLKIKCSDGIVNGILYRWIAIDDQRITVISQFNIKDFQEKNFEFDNANTQIYFISLISVSYIGIVDFQVQVSGITQDKVSVMITSLDGQLSNILSFGYQIVLGTEDILQPLGMKQTDSLKAFISQQYPLKSESSFVIPLKGLQYDSINLLKFMKIYHFDESFQWYEFTAIGCCCNVAQIHEPVLINYMSTFQFTPFIFGQVQIKQVVDSKINYINSFQAQIQGNSHLITNLGETKHRIHKDNKSIFLSINVKCSSNEILLLEFYYGSNPHIDTKYFKHKCNGIFKEIFYTVQLVPTVTAYQYLIINIAEEKCEISQILYNQQQQRVKLFEIKKTIL